MSHSSVSQPCFCLVLVLSFQTSPQERRSPELPTNAAHLQECGFACKWQVAVIDPGFSFGAACNKRPGGLAGLLTCGCSELGLGVSVLWTSRQEEPYTLGSRHGPRFLEIPRFGLLSIYVAIYLPICRVLVYLSICLSVCLSVCL